MSMSKEHQVNDAVMQDVLVGTHPRHDSDRGPWCERERVGPWTASDRMTVTPAMTVTEPVKKRVQGPRLTKLQGQLEAWKDKAKKRA